MTLAQHNNWVSASRSLIDVQLYVLETRNDTPALYETRRRLPHYVPDGLIVMLNFYQADAVPKKVIANMCEEYRQTKDNNGQGEDAFVAFFEHLESQYDAAGGLFLGETGKVINDAILHIGQQGWLVVYAYTVMPTHVHMIVRSGTKSVAPACADFKHFTTTTINRKLKLQGKSLWEREFFDRWIRSDAHFMHAMRYIHDNPVKAGLCAAPTDWCHSSARWYV